MLRILWFVNATTNDIVCVSFGWKISASALVGVLVLVLFVCLLSGGWYVIPVFVLSLPYHCS